MISLTSVAKRLFWFFFIFPKKLIFIGEKKSFLLRTSKMSTKFQYFHHYEDIWSTTIDKYRRTHTHTIYFKCLKLEEVCLRLIYKRPLLLKLWVKLVAFK